MYKYVILHTGIHTYMYISETIRFGHSHCLSAQIPTQISAQNSCNNSVGFKMMIYLCQTSESGN